MSAFNVSRFGKVFVMRRILISLLLASAAASPAIAAPHNWAGSQDAQQDRQSAHDDRQAAREEKQAAREEKQAAREERSQAREESRSERSNAHQYEQQAQQQVQQQQAQQQLREQQRSERNYARPDRPNAREGFQGNNGGHVAPGAREVTFQDRQQERQDARELRQSNRPVPNVMRDRHPPIVSNTPAPGTQPPLSVDRRRGPQVQWNTSWRNNNHYDWHNYRNHHRSHFHLGFYYDPYGWGYQPFSIGWRLWPSYYSRNYWISDPWMYRLPYAPAGYVWIRYWNDALLVDTWSGQVVDMIPDFFW